MKNLSCIILLFFFSLSAAAQSDTNISGIIQDTEGKFISYVNVGIVGTRTGTVSNEDGTYQIFFNSTINENDTMRFSIIGYKSQSYPIKDMRDQQTIILEEETFDLSEIVVRPELTNRKTLGRTKSSGNLIVNFSLAKKPRQNMGAAIGKKFRVKNVSTKIENIRFYIRSNNFGDAKFRVSFYSVKKNKPDKHIIADDIIATVRDKKTGWVEVDLTTYDIYTKNDFIATIQWVDSSSDGTSLAMPLLMPAIGVKHYYKFGSQSKWKRFRNMSTCMTVGLAY